MVFVLRLTEERQLARQMSNGAIIEVVAMQMRDQHGVQTGDDLLSRQRQRHERVALVVTGIFHGGPRASLVEHRVDK